METKLTEMRVAMEEEREAALNEKALEIESEKNAEIEQIEMQ